MFAKVLNETIDGSVPEWKQPDSTNAYMTGDKVMFEGQVYESLIDNNVWSPSANPSGWQLVEEEVEEAPVAEEAPVEEVVEEAPVAEEAPVEEDDYTWIFEGNNCTTCDIRKLLGEKTSLDEADIAAAIHVVKENMKKAGKKVCDVKEDNESFDFIILK